MIPAILTTPQISLLHDLRTHLPLFRPSQSSPTSPTIHSTLDKQVMGFCNQVEATLMLLASRNCFQLSKDFLQKTNNSHNMLPLSYLNEGGQDRGDLWYR